MASAYKGDDRIAASWVGDGTTAEGDFHHALQFRLRLSRAGDPQRRQQPMGDFELLRASPAASEATFASRAIGYGLPALRVDGNDFLAVYAATQWAAERARANLGATLIELYTYRAEGHSTSDDPSRYRPADEAKAWPLGDPIERLKQHLIALGEWTDEQQRSRARRKSSSRCAPPTRRPKAIGTLGQRPAAQRQDHVRGRVQGHALASAPPAPGDGSLTMATMNMIQALNSAMDVMLTRDPERARSSARMSAISAACSAPPKACRRSTA